MEDQNSSADDDSFQVQMEEDSSENQENKEEEVERTEETDSTVKDTN